VDLASGTGTFRLKAKRDSQNAKFTIKNVGQTPLHLFAASLMPADNIDGFRADTIKLLKELNAPIYRWPGGNFVSGYEWRDGLGDPDLRPTRRNPAWTGIETNDVGTHEFLKFCEILGTEPMVVVNTGFGDPYSAGQWVEYLNGAYETPMGQLRFKNGRREPWKVKWWGVGNEMFGNWQLGYMALEQYTLKHNETVDRMRAVDPAVKLVGVGAVGRWSQVMLGRCADSMDQISEHTYIFNDMPDVPGYVRKLPSSIATIAKAHRQYRATIPALKGKDIKINLDEWNYWHGPQVFGELGVRYRMKDGLGVAAGLHEIIRNSDLFGMAMYAQTVNVIGAIKTDRTQAAMETTGLVLALYRKEFGSIPVDVTGTMMQVDMDTVAAWTADRKALTVAIVNPYREPMNVSLKLDGGSFAPEAKHWVIASPDAMDHNDPKDPEKIKIVQRSLNFTGSLELAGYSVNLLRFEAR